MTEERTQVCPVEYAGSLDNKVRKWFQNPEKILRGFVKPSMKVLDIGCGPGFFSVEIAKMVETSGRVYAADLQQGMLDKVEKKVTGTSLQNIIKTVKVTENSIPINDKVDFILAFYMVHEVPNQLHFFNMLKPLLFEYGEFLIVEPKHFHVSVADFNRMLGHAVEAGFNIKDGPKLPLSQTVILTV